MKIKIDKIIPDDEFDADFEQSLARPLSTVEELREFKGSGNSNCSGVLNVEKKKMANELILCHDMKGTFTIK